MSARTLSRGIWIELAFWLTVSLAAFVLTFEFSAETGSYLWGAASWPRAILLLMALGAVVQCIFRVRQSGQAAADAEDAAADEEKSLASTLKMLAVFGLPLVYVFLLPRTGFYVTTPAFLLAYLILLGERRWKMLLGVTLFIFALLNLIFTVLFFVALPTGTWPGFYDVSNWFVSLLQ